MTQFSIHVCLDEPDDEAKESAEDFTNLQDYKGLAYDENWLEIAGDLEYRAGVTVVDTWFGFEENCDHGNCAKITLESEDSSIPPSSIVFDLEAQPGIYSADTNDESCIYPEIYACLRNASDSIPAATEEEAEALLDILHEEGWGGSENDLALLRGDLHSNVVELCKSQLEWFRDCRKNPEPFVDGVDY